MSKIAVQGSAELSGKVEDPGILSKKSTANAGRFRPLVHHSEYGLAKTPSEENFWRNKYTTDDEEDDPQFDDNRNRDKIADAVIEMKRLALLEDPSGQQARNNEQSDGFSGIQRFVNTAEGNTTEFQFMGNPDYAAFVEQQFSNVIKMTYEAFMMGKKLENRMLVDVFDDLDVTQWQDLLVQHWLPHIPTATKKHFSSYDRPSLFREAYYLIQIYAIGFEQIVEDRVKAHSPLMGDFLNLHKKLQQMVQDYLDSMKKLKITNFSSIQKSYMPGQYRNLRVKICTELRDYIILSHFNRGSSYICRGLCYMRYAFD